VRRLRLEHQNLLKLDNTRWAAESGLKLFDLFSAKSAYSPGDSISMRNAEFSALG
jgi:hypothetical protein